MGRFKTPVLSIAISTLVAIVAGRLVITAHTLLADLVVVAAVAVAGVVFCRRLTSPRAGSPSSL